MVYVLSWFSWRNYVSMVYVSNGVQWFMFLVSFSGLCFSALYRAFQVKTWANFRCCVHNDLCELNAVYLRWLPMFQRLLYHVFSALFDCKKIWPNTKKIVPLTCNVATLLWPSVGLKPNTWKKWGFGVLRDSRMFRARQQGPKHLALRCSWCHWKGLEA